MIVYCAVSVPSQAYANALASSNKEKQISLLYRSSGRKCHEIRKHNAKLIHVPWYHPVVVSKGKLGSERKTLELNQQVSSIEQRQHAEIAQADILVFVPALDLCHGIHYDSGNSLVHCSADARTRSTDLVDESDPDPDPGPARFDS